MYSKWMWTGVSPSRDGPRRHKTRAGLAFGRRIPVLRSKCKHSPPEFRSAAGSRDDFSSATKEMLARRVGHLCSNPGCRQPTSGPQENPAKAINIGVAAHISAAAPGGPRYDPSLSSSERTAGENGIWLCQSCGKLVDNDPLNTPLSFFGTGKALQSATQPTGWSIGWLRVARMQDFGRLSA